MTGPAMLNSCLHGAEAHSLSKSATKKIVCHTAILDMWEQA